MSDAETECPTSKIAALVQAIQSDAEVGMRELEVLLGDYPADARLRFLQGSLLAGSRRHGEAQDAMLRAVEIAPDYAVARFQLGFLQLTSGDPTAAEATWAPLGDLPQGHYLRLFSIGLGHFMRDDFAQAIALLKEGIARNTEILPINHDMGLLLQESQKILDGGTPAEAASSATQILLQQFGSDRTRH